MGDASKNEKETRNSWGRVRYTLPPDENAVGENPIAVAIVVNGLRNWCLLQKYCAAFETLKGRQFLFFVNGVQITKLPTRSLIVPAHDTIPAYRCTGVQLPRALYASLAIVKCFYILFKKRLKFPKICSNMPKIISRRAVDVLARATSRRRIPPYGGSSTGSR